MRFIVFVLAAMIGLVSIWSAGYASEPASPQRVITVGAPATEIVFALGAGDRVIATDTTSTLPEAVGDLPKVGYMRTLATEGIVGLKPDLILVVEKAGPDAALKDLVALGIPVVKLPSLDHLANLPDAIRITADALHLGDIGQEMASRVRDDIASIQNMAGADHAKIVFLMAVGHGQPMSAGRNTTADEIIHLVGGENPMDSYDGFKPVSPEAITADASDYVLMPDSTLDHFGGLAGLSQHPALGLHPAVAQGRVLTMSSSTILGFGPRSVGEIRLLAEKLHNISDPK
ncbi:hemin ABC transporter substrate-binding protein [Thalassospira sp.]|uniref:heme/hemin ABC transporter substrate-binding protein n=1 Tax=Thalassospira sp. TaxID=1912094 RepID=UPI002735AF9D|nr:ABC transporter substrate-binding protein [Thalassospira sp.]MDP2699101.1 ABC transporter substrate-binding protein [Thalassospira sp.]